MIACFEAVILYCTSTILYKSTAALQESGEILRFISESPYITTTETAEAYNLSEKQIVEFY